MIPLLLATTLITDGPAPLTDAQKVDMFCAYVVGVKYGTDNVTEDELIRFSVCRNSLAVPENPKKGLI